MFPNNLKEKFLNFSNQKSLFKSPPFHAPKKKDPCKKEGKLKKRSLYARIVIEN